MIGEEIRKALEASSFMHYEESCWSGGGDSYPVLPTEVAEQILEEQKQVIISELTDILLQEGLSEEQVTRVINRIDNNEY